MLKRDHLARSVGPADGLPGPQDAGTRPERGSKLAGELVRIADQAAGDLPADVSRAVEVVRQWRTNG